MNTSPKLREFVQSQVSEAKLSNLDRTSRGEFWIAKVNELYLQIESYLKDLADEGLVSIAKEKCTINENFIGSYEIESMLIKIGKNDILLYPVGTLIIAGRGRVDMKGPEGEVMLILFGKGEKPTFTVRITTDDQPAETMSNAPEEPKEFEWVVVKKRGQKDYPILNQDSFLDALRVVIGDVEAEPV